MRSTPTRRAAGILAGILVAAVLPALVPSTAHAAEPDGCLSENAGLLQQKCDDSTQPVTTIDSVTPTPRNGWLQSTTVTIAFAGAHTDADTDPIGFQCQFFNTAAAPTTWQTCTSPVRYEDLEQNSATPYTFRVRAVDTADDAIDATAGLLGAKTDIPDYDETPEEVVFRADATAPSTFGFLRTHFYDEDRQDAPMLLSRSVQFRLQSDEGGRGDAPTYRCRLNDRPVTCHDGLTTLRKLGAGRQDFSAAAVDPAGNVDPTPYTQSFYVPRNLTTRDATRTSKGAWRKVRNAGSFGGDYLQTTRYGATVSFPVRNIRAIRLLAPAGPGLGTVEIRVGQGRWMPVRLAAKKRERMKVHQVRGDLSGLLAGPLQVRVTSRGKLVRIDAVMAR